MKRIINLLVWYGLLATLVVSCGNINTNTPIPSVTPKSPPNWWNVWFDQPSCKLPCWENITPGITKNEEALSSLKDIPTIEITYQSKKFGIEWDSKEDKSMYGFLKATEDGVVRFIALGPSRSTTVTLETIVVTYGYPSYIEPYDCREGMCATVLLYPDLGMLLDVFVEDLGSHKVEIQPETKIERTTLIPTGLENYKKFPEYQDYGTLMKWKGYGEYP